MTDYSIVFDGGAIGNPGLGYGSFEIIGPEGLRILERVEFSENGEQVTNNEAEYKTLIRALERLLAEIDGDPKRASVTIHGDSLLIVNQVNGDWKIKKPQLRELKEQVVQLLNKFGETGLRWHDRLNSVWILGH
ncbi:MAG: ribonuclease HI family protein [Thermomicrobiales bacterium]